MYNRRRPRTNYLPNTIAKNISVMSRTTNMWPSKYESKYESLKEIPKDCIRKLLTAIDKDLDGRIGFEELVDFVNNAEMTTFPVDTLEAMFREITDRRSVVRELDRDSPITFSELNFCCK